MARQRKKGPPASQVAAASIQRFFWRTVVPLIPLFVVFYALMFVNNQDVEGDYQGSSPTTGLVDLTLQDKGSNQVAGELKLKQIYRMVITRGVVQGDDVDLHFEIPGNENLTPRFKGTRFAGPVSNFNMFNIVSQGDYIEGDFYNGLANSLPVRLKLRRNSAIAMFKKYWFRF